MPFSIPFHGRLKIIKRLIQVVDLYVVARNLLDFFVHFQDCVHRAFSRTGYIEIQDVLEQIAELDKTGKEVVGEIKTALGAMPVPRIMEHGLRWVEQPRR